MGGSGAGRAMIVGVDGSVGSAAALAWAAARTDRFGPVRPVAAWQYPWWSMAPLASGAAGMPPADVNFEGLAREMIDEQLAALGPAVTGEPILVRGPAGQALVEAGQAGTLLVVGTRGHGTVAAGVLGSVSLYCVNHATVPVVVVPAEASPEDRHQRVVVGFDGSVHAVAALDWALANTGPGTQVDVIHCCKPGEAPQLAHDLLADAVSAAVARRADAEPGLAARVAGSDLDGDPRHALREASASADLLVLGARGHHGVAHLLVGSVATGLVHHPLAPTVIVR